MKKYIRNLEHSTIFVLSEQVDYLPGQIVSKTLAQNKHHSLTLFAFDREEEISTHQSEGDAMVTVLDGVGKFVVGDKAYFVRAGESMVMPANIPHAVYGHEKFKMLLIVIFPDDNEEPVKIT